MWKTVKLGDIVDIARGGSPRPIKSFITDEIDGVNWIKIGDTKEGEKYIVSTKEKIKKSGTSRSRYVKEGDFLLSNSMSFGRPYILKTDGCIHDGWLVLSNYENEFNADYLYYLLSSSVVKKQFESSARGSTVRNLNIELVSKVVLSYPPLAEQQRIVAKLDAAFAEIDKAIEVTQATTQNFEKLKKQSIQSILKNEVYGWNIKKLNQISENLDSKRVPITKSKRSEGGIPYYGASGIVDYVEDWIFDDELLLISEDGANLLMRTYPIAFAVSGKTWVNNHAHVLKFTNLKQQEWVENYLNSIDLSGFISGMAQPKLNQKKLNEIPIPIPSDVFLQEVVSTVVEAKIRIAELTYTAEKKFRSLHSLKSAILAQELQSEAA